MGIMDKLKAQATELAEKAQAGVTQGQAKVSELQAKRRADALLRDLDRHAAEHGPVSTAPTADSASVWSAAVRGGGAGGSATDDAASGGYAGDTAATAGAHWPDSGTADVPPPAAGQFQAGATAPGGLPGGELRDAGGPIDEPLGGEPVTGEEPSSDAHTVTGVGESMPGPAGDNIR